MRNLACAMANSHNAKKWNNTFITKEELFKKLQTTSYTSETVAEYQSLSKVSRDDAKDVGGFVGGLLKDGLRRKANVVYRSMLALDCDNPEPDFLEKFTSTFDYCALLYSTHSHTTDKPRFRIIIPLSKDVNADAFNAISRYLCEKLGMADCKIKLNT